MSHNKQYIKKAWRTGICLCILFFILVVQAQVMAQPPQVKSYTVKDGRMYITLSKHIPDGTLDSFISKFDLQDLALRMLLRNNITDSLRKLGWSVDINNDELCVISKTIMTAGTIQNDADKIRLTQKQTFAERFPAVNNGIIIGYNRFRNKFPFTQTPDSFVTFFLRGSLNAKKVRLAGSFNDWNPDNLPMIKTDSGWIAKVKLSTGKYWYKFIVDGRWMTDSDNRLNENDGLGNTNSAFFVTNVVFNLDGYTNAKNVYLAGSFNGWSNHELQMLKTNGGWQLPVYLAEGTYTYKFIVDDNWIEDPKNKNRSFDEKGNFNSVISLGKPHLFHLKGYTNAKKVALSGSFNSWRTNELIMQKTNDGWKLPYILGPGNYQYKFIIDGKWIADPENLSGNNDGSANSYFIIDPNYTFRLKGYPNAKRVSLAGDFNDWDPESFVMKRSGDDWVFSVHLSNGKHLYKFIVDGKWIIDPSNKLWEQNQEHTGNSVIWVGN